MEKHEGSAEDTSFEKRLELDKRRLEAEERLHRRWGFFRDVTLIACLSLNMVVASAGYWKHHDHSPAPESAVQVIQAAAALCENKGAVVEARQDYWLTGVDGKENPSGSSCICVPESGAGEILICDAGGEFCSKESEEQCESNHKEHNCGPHGFASAGKHD